MPCSEVPPLLYRTPIHGSIAAKSLESGSENKSCSSNTENFICRADTSPSVEVEAGDDSVGVAGDSTKVTGEVAGKVKGEEFFRDHRGC